MKPKDLRTAAAVAVVAGLALIAVYLNRAGALNPVRPSLVRMQVGEETFEFETADRIPANWLAQAGVSLYPGDEIALSGEIVPPDQPLSYQSVYQIELQRVKEVVLTQDGETRRINAAATLGETLWDAGIPLWEADFLTAPPDLPVIGSIEVSLEASRPLTIEVDGITAHARAAAATVGAALAEAGFPLQGLDYSLPAEDQPVPPDGVIRLVRVSEEVVIQQETTPFETQLQPDPEAELDTFSLIQAGEYGLEASRVRIRYEDGQEISREVEDVWQAHPPKARIEGYGTKIVIRTIDTPDGPVEYWRAVEMYATSYSPCRSAGEEGRCYYYTSLGDEVKRGVVAVIYDWFIPMGNHTVYVPGYGHAKISDVGAGIPGRHWIDLGYSDDDWVSWSQWVTVYFTTPVPPEYEILYFLPYK